MYDFYEFFAGGGMTRAGLGSNWKCLFANDFDHKKSRVYQDNWGAEHFKTGDVKALATNDIPGCADLAWGSFPCQDLSLAGGGAGLKGDRSGTFWPFWKVMTGLMAENRAPRIIVLENVCGTLSSHGGKDFAAIGAALQKASYRFGALVVDAALFVPQSRPRLFIVAIHKDQPVPARSVTTESTNPWHTRALRTAYERLPARARQNWIWWNLPAPPVRRVVFSDLVEENPKSVTWHTPEQTRQLLGMMSDVNIEKVEDAKLARRKMVGCIYKRTRRDEFARKVQRAEGMSDWAELLGESRNTSSARMYNHTTLRKAASCQCLSLDFYPAAATCHHLVP